MADLVKFSLTDKQERFVEFVAKGHNTTEAARLAGYGYPAREAYRLMRNPALQKALHEERGRLVAGDLATMAVEAFRDLLKPSAPANVRFQAAKWVMEVNGHTPASAMGATGSKPLHEMSEDELAAFVASGEAALQSLRSRPPVIEVAPVIRENDLPDPLS